MHQSPDEAGAESHPAIDASCMPMADRNRNRTDIEIASVTRAQAVADELRRMIEEREFPPGAHLRQAQIAKSFGVSTTPVREAFTALAREGMVQQDAHRGVRRLRSVA